MEPYFKLFNSGDMKPRPPPSRPCASPQLHHAGHKGQARKTNGYPRTDPTFVNSRAWISRSPPRPNHTDSTTKPETPHTRNATSNNLSLTSLQTITLKSPRRENQTLKSPGAHTISWSECSFFFEWPWPEKAWCTKPPNCMTLSIILKIPEREKWKRNDKKNVENLYQVKRFLLYF